MKMPQLSDFIGERAGARTRDALIKSPRQATENIGETRQLGENARCKINIMRMLFQPKDTPASGAKALN